MPKRTLKRNSKPRVRKIGFRARNTTKKGKAILKGRRAKGRVKISI